MKLGLASTATATPQTANHSAAHARMVLVCVCVYVSVCVCARPGVVGWPLSGTLPLNFKTCKFFKNNAHLFETCCTTLEFVIGHSKN